MAVPVALPLAVAVPCAVGPQTPQVPSQWHWQADCDAACGGITPDTLPAGLPPGYTIDSNSTWSPTYAFYSSENSPIYENECWVEVVAKK